MQEAVQKAATRIKVPSLELMFGVTGAFKQIRSVSITGFSGSHCPTKRSAIDGANEKILKLIGRPCDLHNPKPYKLFSLREFRLGS